MIKGEMVVGDHAARERAMQDLARHTVSGRVRLEPGTMLLPLTTLAKAEGDTEHARGLLMVSTAGVRPNPASASCMRQHSSVSATSTVG